MTRSELTALIENIVDTTIEKRMQVLTERFEEKMYASLGRRVVSDSARSGGGSPFANLNFEAGQPNNGTRVDEAISQMRVLESRVRGGLAESSNGATAQSAGKKPVPNFLLGDQLAAALSVKGDYE